MTDDEILELAADFLHGGEQGTLVKFARAVAAKEREACAKECENLKVGFPSYAEIDEYIQECASAIRARAWSDVPNATKWVDDLRGGDEWTPDDMAYRPNGLSAEEPVGEIVEAHGLISVSIPEMPPVGTKLYTAPKREWQWLTYRELQEIIDSMKTWNSFDITDFYVAIEAKLKEKNHAS